LIPVFLTSEFGFVRKGIVKLQIYAITLFHSCVSAKFYYTDKSEMKGQT